MKHVCVEAVNWYLEVVMLTDGTILPITNYFDEDNDEVDKDDPSAVEIVAGMGDIWIRERMDVFRPVTATN